MEVEGPATLALAGALAIIMFALGTTLAVEDFRRVATAPRGVGVGLLNLFLVTPLLAIGVAEAFSLDPVFATGIVLLGAAPGGVAANLLTHMARGDTALSVSMTAISSAASIITVPLYLGVATALFGTEQLDGDVSMPVIAGRVVLGIGIPLAAGMWFAARRPDVVERRGRAIQGVALGTFGLLVAGVIVAEAGTVLDHLGELLAATLALNLAAMAASLLTARAARLEPAQATAIAIELGVHNVSLAIAIGASIDERLAIPGAVYGSFQVGTAGLLAWWLQRRHAPITAA